jgi:predicted MFS family arabinose efflux permease
MGIRFPAAWWGTVVLFLVHGLVISTWISRIPAVQSSLRLNNFELGLALLAAAVGALCSIPVTGFLVGRFGSKRVSVSVSTIFSLSLLLPATAVNGVTLGLALYIFGAAAAAMDVAMNSQAVEVEKMMERPTMSRFHGMFSLGAMLGAAAGGALAARGMGPLAHFALSGAVNAAAVLAVGGRLLDTHDAHKNAEHRVPFHKMPRVLLALSAIGFCILLAEGAMADWTALYLRQVLKAGPGTAAAGYSVFSAAMAVMRLLGDMVTARLGPQRAVRAGSLVAAAGLGWALCMRDAAWAMPGFAVVGCGFSVIIPLVFGSAGRVKGVAPGAGIASVTGIGYAGFMAGPPTIGSLSQLLTLRWALLVVVACCLVSAVAAQEMKGLDMGGPLAPEAEGFGVAGHL